MKKFFYILPTLFIETPVMKPSDNVVKTFIHVDGVALDGYFMFIKKEAPKGARKEVSLSVRLELSGVKNQEYIDFVRFGEIIGIITKNYRGISDVLGAAYLNGLLSSE